MSQSPLIELPSVPAPGAPEDFEPVYFKTYRKGLIHQKVEEAIEALRSCELCPRNCKVDRLAGKTATCHTGRHAIVSSWGPHHGEESCLRGFGGSGTIFFAFCNLCCQFCQNWDISQKGAGTEMYADEIARAMIHLQESGCHNINFVTPEHVVPQALEATLIAIENGLKLPIVYNTGGYDSLHSLSLMDGVVDIYMPDFKFWKEETAFRLALAKDYPEAARQAIREMHRQVGPLQIDHEGLALRGVLVRYLVMPNQTDESKEIFNFLVKELSPDTYVNIMGQYYPSYKADKFPEINRYPSQGELSAAYQLAEKAGLHRFDKK